MSINDDFGLDDIIAPVAPAKGKKAAPKDAEKFIDPEDDRANWPIIKIDAEEGQPNYKYIGSHGTKKNGDSFNHELQIMRGVEVAVPPSVVYGLQDAVATHIYMRRDPHTGRNIQERQDRSDIPWRMIKGGKYF